MKLVASRVFSRMSGQVEWKSEALELSPRLLIMKRFARNGALCAIHGNGLNGIIIKNIPVLLDNYQKNNIQRKINNSLGLFHNFF